MLTSNTVSVYKSDGRLQINIPCLEERLNMTALIIQHLKASELPAQWAHRLKMQPEQTVTVRIEMEETNSTEQAVEYITDDPAFGIWRDYKETEDTASFARNLRTSRYNRDGSRNES
jgi:hypothetical protein